MSALLFELALGGSRENDFGEQADGVYDPPEWRPATIDWTLVPAAAVVTARVWCQNDAGASQTPRVTDLSNTLIVAGAASTDAAFTEQLIVIPHGVGVLSYKLRSTIAGATTKKVYLFGSILATLPTVAAITVAPPTVPAGTVGTAYSQVISATGGDGGPYTFTRVDGVLPAGLTLSAGGSLSGTPISSTSTTFTVRATDTSGTTGDRAYTLTIVSGVEATGLERPLPLFTDQQWASLPNKALASGLVAGAYFDHRWLAGLARLNVWPVPSDSTQRIVLYAPQALAGFADLTTAYTLPPGLVLALRYALAVELAAWFGVPIPPQVENKARTSLGDLKRLSTRLVELTLDPTILGAASRGPYDITVDG
jgi:hypothetical protein